MSEETLHLAYLSNHEFESWAGTTVLKHFELGSIQLPTGQIHAVDPLVFLDNEQVFEISVDPGDYPVQLCLACFPEGDQRVAFAMIRFSDIEATSWRMATVPGQDESTLKKGEAFGYPVDSATGSFMDKAAGQLLLEKHIQDQHYYERITEGLDKTYVHTWSCLNLPLSDECNLVAFSSGFGDGIYPSYFGFSDSTKPVCLLTDFGVVDPSDKETPKHQPKWWQFWRKRVM